jgi:lysophospholipase L1-like esterase
MGTGMTRRSRLVATAGALLVGLLLAEGLVRWRFADEVDPARLRAAREAMDVSPLLRGSADPLLAFEPRPDLDLRLAGWHVVTDADGLRVRATPPPEPRPPGAPLRIAVIGASGSFGLRMQAEESWPHLVAGRLERALGRPVEVLNASVPAYVASQQVRLLELRVLPWQPDLVIWHYDHRDAFPVDHPNDVVSLAPEDGNNLLHSALLKLVLRRMRQTELDRPELLLEEQTLSEEGYFRGGPLYDAHLAALRHAAAQCRAQGVPVVLFVFDAFLEPGRAAQRHHKELHVPLLPVLANAGFQVFDLYPVLLGIMEQNGWPDLSPWWRSAEPLDGHFNAEGHAWLAARLTAWLVGDGEVLR